MSDNLPKYKQIYTKNRSVVFNRSLEQLSHRSIIIFYDDYYNEYHYIKTRSSYDKNGNKKNKYEGEIFIPAANKGLLNTDTYVDTTQIYSIKKNDLEKIVNKNSNIFLTTNHFTKNQIREISLSLMRNLRKNEPLVSWIEVKLDQNSKPTPTLKYCHKKYINEVTKHVTDNEKKLKIEYYILEKLNQNETTITDLKSLGAEVKTELDDYEHTWKNEENEIIEDDYVEEYYDDEDYENEIIKQIKREEEDEMEM
ncbi:Mbov_0400 family ICE element protein [[Mycoplasma] collis]|uniref:Mbov_0400 family ICE element protein n=1 Tax=[Mycoplasma] collis TaxID=2127 RepID=UPI00051AEF17|nr:hypothetical protein [[Mycoplasma] collis]